MQVMRGEECLLALLAMFSVVSGSSSNATHSTNPYSPSYTSLVTQATSTSTNAISSYSHTPNWSRTPASGTTRRVSSTSKFQKVTEAPPGISVMSDQILTLPTDKLQTTCSSSGIPLQTSFWMQGGQVNFEGGQWFSGKTTNWTFSTDTPGVVLGVPFIPDAQDPDSEVANIKFDVVNRTERNKFDLSIGPITSNTVMFLVFNDNGSTIPQDTWKLFPGERLSDATDFEDISYEQVLFRLDIEGYGVCDFPVSNATCQDGEITQNMDTWMAYRVDDFLAGWLSKYNGSFPRNNLMETFKTDFGIHTDVCSVQKECDSLQKCSVIGSWSDPNAIAIFLAYEAMSNLANYFNMLYTDVVNNYAPEIEGVSKIVNDFFPAAKPSVDPQKAHPKPLQLGSLLLGMASFGMMAIPGVGTGLGVATGLAAGAMGIGAAYENDPAKSQDPQNSQWTNAANLQDDLNTIVSNLENTIEQWQTATLSYGTNFSQIFQGGAMINQSEIEFDSNATSVTSSWLQQFVTVKLINHAWWMQNVFITFMPYGQVKKIAGSPGDGDMQEFDEGQCVSNFLFAESINNTLGNVETNRPIVCSTDAFFDGISDLPLHDGKPVGPGMARLTWYDSSPSKVGPGLCAPSGHGSSQWTHETVNISQYPPGFNQTPPPTFLSPGGDYTFSTQDVIASSLKSWIIGGYDYDLLSNLTNMASGAPSDTDALKALSGIGSAKPSDAGMFNLPVVVVKDLNNWPDSSTMSGYYNLWGSQKDQFGKNIAENGTLSPQLQDFLTRADGDLPIIPQSC